jgi:hypothetical protein
MNLAIDVVLHAGRSAVDVALYKLLPIMVHHDDRHARAGNKRCAG